MTNEMVTYYARRAGEYDRIYDYPHWQADLGILVARVAELFAGRRVFEVACGTAYWTAQAARRAAHVHATDLNEDTLAVARWRLGGRAGVTFERRDAYAPRVSGPTYDAGLAAFWLSHVDRARMGTFLDAFHSHLAAGAPVCMFDERQARFRITPASRHDDAGNRYERRRLASGDAFEIIKNLYDGRDLRDLLAGRGREIVYEELENFWMLTYRALGAVPARAGSSIHEARA